MRSRLAIPALVLASLFGATTFASAQTATGAAELNAMASTRHHHYHHHYHHHMGYSGGGYSREMARSRPGGRPVSRKPAD